MEKFYFHNTRGFTLIELIVAMTIGSIIMGLIASTYYLYSNISSKQERVLEVQQSLRSSLYLLERDILMTGYQPDPSNPAGVGIELADKNRLRLSYVVTDTGNESDVIEYYLSNDNLVRTDTHAAGVVETAILADNIEEIQFLYIFKDGSVGFQTIVNSNYDFEDIRGISISLLSKSRFENKGASENRIFTPVSNGQTLIDTTVDNTVWGPYNDNFIRQLITTTIHCRNLNYVRRK